MSAYLHMKQVRADGTSDSFVTMEVAVKESPMEFHRLGLTWTASGYGKRIPTRYLVQFNGRWRRVYSARFGNAGTAYIGKLNAIGEVITVTL